MSFLFTKDQVQTLANTIGELPTSYGWRIMSIFESMVRDSGNQYMQHQSEWEQKEKAAESRGAASMAHIDDAAEYDQNRITEEGHP